MIPGDNAYDGEDEDDCVIGYDKDEDNDDEAAADDDDDDDSGGGGDDIGSGYGQHNGSTIHPS